MHRGANRACAIILPLPKSDCRSTCLGFAGGTHIDTLKLDAPAIMDDMHRGANRACAIILPLPKTDCCSAWLGFAGGTHIDILKLDAPAIMGFRVERYTVKFANSKGAETITTALWARWLRHNAFF
ncbi:hypothetical protein MRX96_033992 [Rhipicephalus microplus]